jgi:hypothetical protein
MNSNSILISFYLIFFNRLALLFIGTVVRITNGHQNYNVTRYLHSPGIHYENIGYTRLYNMETQLLTYLNIADIKDRLDVITSAHAKTVRFCDSQTLQILCNNYKVVLDQALPVVRNQVEEIFNLVGHKPRNDRVKRAWFDIIGKGAKVLFGTLDEDDANYYSEKIAKFDKNEDTLADLIKGQSKVVKSTISSFNSTIHSLHNNEKTLIENINKLEGLTKETDAHLKSMEFHVALQEHLIFFEFLFFQFQLHMNSISQACLLAQKGIIHSSIITPTQIMEKFRTFSQDLAPGVTFPLSMTKDNTLNLIKIIKVSIAFSKGFLIYILNMPLPESMEFETFRINPFPAPLTDDKFVFIQPSFEYLAIDRSRIHYVTLNQGQQNRCEVLMKDFFLCKQESPILMTHMHNNCEIKLFMKETGVIDLCDKRIISLYNGHFIQLMKSNKWLFSMPKPEVLTLSCKDNHSPEDIFLSGIGSISIADTCKAYSSTTILTPKRILYSNYTLEILPPLNLSDDCCEGILAKEESRIPIELDHNYNKITLHVQDLNVASHKLDNIVRLTEDLEHRNATKVNVRNFSFFAYILSFLTVCYVAYKIYKKFRRNSCCGRLCIKVEQTVQPKLELTIRENRGRSDYVPSVSFNTSSDDGNGNPNIILSSLRNDS